MTEQERAERFLRQHSGRFFCVACLARTLGISSTVARQLVWTLRRLPDLEMQHGRCVSCPRGMRVIRHVGEAFVSGPYAAVVAFLLANSGIDVCGACVAFATDRSLSAVKDALGELRPFTEFCRHDAVCTVCARRTTVTAAIVKEASALVTETQRYRNWRFDLLSYPISTGWRPFVLIKGPAVAAKTDAPSLFYATLPTKVAADRHAVHAAKQWIDKHFDT
jgi:hypothetical protein